MEEPERAAGVKDGSHHVPAEFTVASGDIEENDDVVHVPDDAEIPLDPALRVDVEESGEEDDSRGHGSHEHERFGESRGSHHHHHPQFDMLRGKIEEAMDRHSIGQRTGGV